MGYIERRKTREVKIGNVTIGGDNPIAIQSMCNTKTSDVKATVAQILALEKAGCEIIRVAVPDMEAALAIKEIKKQIHIPLVADIHFDYSVTPEGLVESAMGHVAILEKYDFHDIVISIKASNVPFTLKCYRQLSQKVDYPLHLGITESGTKWSGTIKSSVGIGAILAMGIGDTIRVSLTGDTTDEVKVAKQILKSLELRKFGVEFVSCPTCGRTQIDLIGLAEKVEKACENVNKDIKVAVMGCAVNGPGEAREADIGVAGGKGYGLIFKKGEILRKLPESELLEALIEEINKL